MKEISEYGQFAETVIQAVNTFEATAANFRALFESATEVSKYNDEELRQLIHITRSIRDSIFRNIDTHVLTIEHLADKQLCQRRARERAAKDSTKTASSGVPRTFTKVPVKSKMEQLLELMNKATPEQLEQALNNVKGK